MRDYEEAKAHLDRERELQGLPPLSKRRELRPDDLVNPRKRKFSPVSLAIFATLSFMVLLMGYLFDLKNTEEHEHSRDQTTGAETGERVQQKFLNAVYHIQHTRSVEQRSSSSSREDPRE